MTRYDLTSTSYLLCDPPPSGWYGHGMPVYQNNHAMAQHAGSVPDHERLLAELDNLRTTYRQAGMRALRMPFSPLLEIEGCHDGIFVTDPGVSTLDHQGNTQTFIANFTETARALEADVFRSAVSRLDVDIRQLPPEAKLEGGEVHYTPGDRFYLGGLNRANEAGHRHVIERSDVEDVALIQSAGFHLDTVLCPVLDPRGKTVAVLACDEALKEEGRDALREFACRRNIEILSVDGRDSIGRHVDGRFEGGSYAVNCLATPGALFGPAPLATPGVAERLDRLGVRHVVTPLSQCGKSGGANHCLTHQLPGLAIDPSDGLFDAFYREQLEKALDILAHLERSRDRMRRVLRWHTGADASSDLHKLDSKDRLPT